MTDAAITAIREAAPAKINLALHVTGKRADGYHLLESLVVFTRFGDTIEIASADSDSLTVDGPFGHDVPADGSNLVLMARDALRSALKISPPAGVNPATGSPVSIRLTKNLPVASGVGGGSSDAATTLKLLASLWGVSPDAPVLHEIALSLGADVPMCLAARALVARGAGEELSFIDNLPAIPLVLVNPNVQVSTARVFSALESTDSDPLPPLPKNFDFHSLRNWLDLTRNDLEVPARKLAPSLNQAIRALNKAESGFSRMSGSGATCFGLFETNNVAKRAAAAIRQRHPDWFVASTRAIASEQPA